MPYARTKAASEEVLPLGPCPKGKNCNRYDIKHIQYEEPHFGISDPKVFRIGHQDTQTQPTYVPTSIYPTPGPKTGFVQKSTAPVAPVTSQPATVENVAKLDFPGSKQGMPYARTAAAPPPVFKTGPCPGGGVPCNKYDHKEIHHEEKHGGISSDTFHIGHQDTQT